MSRQEGTGLPGARQGMGDEEIGRRNGSGQTDQKLTDDWKSLRRQGGAGEPELREEGEIDGHGDRQPPGRREKPAD